MKFPMSSSLYPPAPSSRVAAPAVRARGSPPLRPRAALRLAMALRVTSSSFTLRSRPRIARSFAMFSVLSPRSDSTSHRARLSCAWSRPGVASVAGKTRFALLRLGGGRPLVALISSMIALVRSAVSLGARLLVTIAGIGGPREPPALELGRAMVLAERLLRWAWGGPQRHVTYFSMPGTVGYLIRY